MAFFILFLSNVAFAQDSWFCTEDQAKRSGNTMQVCGVGQSMNDEGYARKRALMNALEEFHILCDNSADCREKPVTVEPKRSSCSTVKGVMTCYRMIEIRILDN